ncbi:MAG TPA: hypothetical protein VH560_03740 [Polyangia bacterium]|jgi:hypothetical protein|nr:hypothetical protein [Polyangia bacterium]
MKIFLIIGFIAACSSAGAACTTVEHVGRPPSAVEIARIDDTVARGRSLAIEPPVDVIRVEPVDPCAGGSCGPPSPRPRRPARRIPRTILSTDGQQIVFSTKGGAPMTLPLDAITSVRVSGADRGRGAALGAAFVAAGATALVGAFALVAQVRLGDPDPGAMASKGCDSTCVDVVAGSFLAAVIAGGIVGAAIGTPHRFVFGAPKAVATSTTP